MGKQYLTSTITKTEINKILKKVYSNRSVPIWEKMIEKLVEKELCRTRKGFYMEVILYSGSLKKEKVMVFMEHLKNGLVIQKPAKGRAGFHVTHFVSKLVMFTFDKKRKARSFIDKCVSLGYDFSLDNKEASKTEELKDELFKIYYEVK
jgi:hypothetical protein